MIRIEREANNKGSSNKTKSKWRMMIIRDKAINNRNYLQLEEENHIIKIKIKIKTKTQTKTKIRVRNKMNKLRNLTSINNCGSRCKRCKNKKDKKRDNYKDKNKGDKDNC